MRRIWLVVVALALLGAACGRGASGPALGPGEAVVRSAWSTATRSSCAVDGRDEQVRLIGIDTPETVDPASRCSASGPRPSPHTHDLLPRARSVRLERDVEARDPYDRLLAYVYRVSDGVFVNLALARDGYAQMLTIPRTSPTATSSGLRSPTLDEPDEGCGRHVPRRREQPVSSDRGNSGRAARLSA